MYYNEIVMLYEGVMSIAIEEKLWKIANKLHNNMKSSEYKYIVLGDI